MVAKDDDGRLAVRRETFKRKLFKVDLRQLFSENLLSPQASSTSRNYGTKGDRVPNQSQKEFRFFTTLRQTYSPDIQRVQFAFKDSMIHFILQFTLLIATGNVLHRCTSQEIHR